MSTAVVGWDAEPGGQAGSQLACIDGLLGSGGHMLAHLSASPICELFWQISYWGRTHFLVATTGNIASNLALHFAAKDTTYTTVSHIEANVAPRFMPCLKVPADAFHFSHVRSRFTYNEDHSIEPQRLGCRLRLTLAL
jgi:hypothetical protein